DPPANLVDRFDFLTCGVSQSVYRLEVLNELLGNCFAYIADAQGKQNFLKGLVFRRFDARQHILDGLLSKSLQGHELVSCVSKAINIGNTAQETSLEERGNRFVAHTLDIHRLATNEMLHASHNLGRASRVVRAVMDGFPIFPSECCATFRTFRRVLDWRGVGCSFS